MRPNSWLAAALALALSACTSASDEASRAGAAGSGGLSPAPADASGGAAVNNAGGTAASSTSGSGGLLGGSAAGSGGNANSGSANNGGSPNDGGSSGTSSNLAGAGGAAAASERCELANYDAAKPPQTLALTGNLGTHDPMVFNDAGHFYLFSTGNNLGAKTSTDLLKWQGVADVFSAETRPAWLADAVPGVSNLWAPDVSFFGGQYHLYYSASTFGSNHSCIGHATRASLSAGAWLDQGQVICSNASTSTKDNWNAIDPNAIVDQTGQAWLALGSFWGGIKLIKLDQTGARLGTSLDALAARPNAGGAVEGAFIVRRCGFYYLFTSWDACCKGADSTYNTRYGRSATLAGPYVDRAGVSLLQGGGSLLLEGGDRYRGPGHNAVVFTDTGAYNVYHAYDANNNGASVLRVSELVWDSDGWPISGGP